MWSRAHTRPRVVLQIMYIVFSQNFEWQPDGSICDPEKNPETACTCNQKYPQYMMISGAQRVRAHDNADGRFLSLSRTL